MGESLFDRHRRLLFGETALSQDEFNELLRRLERVQPDIQKRVELVAGVARLAVRCNLSPAAMLDELDREVFSVLRPSEDS